MAFSRGQKLPKGLDDGIRAPKAKKGKKGNVDDDGDNTKISNKKQTVPVHEVPTIKPGEKMSEFSARVDAALPVSGLINKGAKNGKDPLGLKVGRTKTEKRMHKMYDEWRVEEARRKDKREEAQELAEEEAMSEDENGQVVWKADKVDAAPGASKKKGKKGARKRLIGEVGDKEDDPWDQVRKNRNEKKAGLHDVVLAPPTFKNVPKAKLKAAGAAVDVGDVPKSAGSLRRREELGLARRSIVEGYRAMMKGNRTKLGEEES